MPWLRVDDRMYCNKKVVRASLAAKCLWLWAMNYSADQLTDGVVEASEVQMLAGMLQLPDWQAVTAELVQLGLLELDGEGRYVVHDYLKYNPSREDVLKQREENAKRQADWQARKRGEASDVGDIIDEPPNSLANTVSNGVSKSAPRTRTRTRSHIPEPTENRPADGAKLRAARDSPTKAEGKALPEEAERQRKVRNGLYMALARVCGYAPDWRQHTQPERNELNAAVKGLEPVGYLPEHVDTMDANWRSHFGKATKSPSAFAKWASVLMNPKEEDRRDGRSSSQADPDVTESKYAHLSQPTV